MAWTAPATAVTNTVITANFWNTNARDDENFLNQNEWLLIATQSGNVATYTFSPPSTGYTSLRLLGYLRTVSVNTTDNLLIKLNNDASNIYDGYMWSVTGGGTNSKNTQFGTNPYTLNNAINGGGAPANVFSEVDIIMSNSNNINVNKPIEARSTTRTDTTTIGAMIEFFFAGLYRSTTAVTTIALSSAANFAAGSYMSMYGLV